MSNTTKQIKSALTTRKVNEGAITSKINRLGHLLDEIKVLEAKAKELKAQLIESGVAERITAQYKLAIFTQERGTLDKAAVVEHCGLAWVAQHTNVGKVTVVKVTPIVQDDAKAA